MIRFTVPAVPVPQPRQRHSVRGTGGKMFVTNYTPGKHPVNDYKATVRLAFAESYQGPPLEGPVKMLIRCVFPRTKGKTWKTRPMPRELYQGNKDWDNLAKSTCDALLKLAFVDDKQVCIGTVEKWMAAGDEQPHVYVEISQ